MKASVVIGSSFSHQYSLYLDLIHFQTKLIETVQLGLEDQEFQSYKTLVSTGNDVEFYEQHFKLVDMNKIRYYSNSLVNCILDNFAIEKEIGSNKNLIIDEIRKSILNKSELNVLDISWLSTQFDSVITHAIVRFLGKRKRIQLAVHSERFQEITIMLSETVVESNKKTGL